MMNNEKEKSELTKAHEAGFTNPYVFVEGELHSVTIPGKRYYPKDVGIDARPCRVKNETVYRLTFSDMPKGFAIAEINDFEIDS